MDAHTPGKHLVLREYLKAWMPILGQTQGRIVFIDGFAGPGEYEGGEEGSPLIALRTFIDHVARERFRAEVVFLFIEKDEARATHLERLIAERITLPPRFVYEVRRGVFDETMEDVLGPIEQASATLAPSFVMIDPFGVSDTPMAVIERLLRHPSCEVYVSFMYEAINRFKESPEFPPHLDRLFGTKEWRTAIDIHNSLERKDFLFGLYKRQLRAAGAAHVLHFELYRGDQLIYAVFFATKHLLGCDKMKRAMCKVAPFNDYQFRGARSGQFGLELAADVRPLRAQLVSRFGHDWTTIEDVVAFMQGDETDYHLGHLKTATLKPMEAEGLLQVEGPGGSKHKKGQFPPGTLIRFL